MKKLPLALAISLASVAMASQAATYTTVATSGAVSTAASATTNTYYTNPTPGGVSDKNAAAIQLVKDGDWTFDFSNLAAVTFTGAINYGNYETQTNVTGAVTIQGHIVYTGVTQSFSGVGSYNDVTNTFTYIKAAGAANSNGGSVYTQGAAATCKNGATSALGKVCTSWAATSADWEGLNLSFVFDEARTNFSGTVKGTEKSGSGFTASTSTINWTVAGEAPPAPVPLPAAAWLFGSALVGLAGIKRRKA